VIWILCKARVETNVPDIDWRKALREAAAQALEQTGRGLLLSQVPAVLKRVGLDPVEVAGRRKLLEFLQHEAEGGYQLVQNELNASLWAILPPDTSVSEPYSQYFPSPENPKPSNDIPRFIPEFWQAFQRPLGSGLRRWLFKNGGFHYEDRSETEQLDVGVEIEREYVRDQAALFITNEVTYAKIQEWAAKHKLDLREFIYFVRPSTSETSHSSNALEAFLKALKPYERTKISLPADVVARLLGI